MKDVVQQKIEQWYNEGDREVFPVADQIEYLNKMLYYDYEPAIGPKPDFNSRLRSWLSNVQTSDDQKLLFKLIPRLFYVGKNEFDTLYRIAYNTNTIKWIIESEGLSLDKSLQTNLKSALKKTWFCPVTDSMRINQFYHLNGIDGADKRPEWRSLEAFGSKDKIESYLIENDFQRIVLLEDFVGSGNQIKSSVEFAAETFSELNFLVVPILMCPKADEIITELSGKYQNVTIEPVIRLGDQVFLKKDREENEEEFIKSVHDLSKKSHKTMKKRGFKWPFLGFRKIGGLIVLHTNTPNNSLPIIWSDTDWSPLFNRHVR